MRYLLFTLLLLTALPAFAADKESTFDRVMRTGVLKCGFVPWDPYFKLDPNTGALSGFSKDLSDSVAKILDLKIEYVQITMGEQIQDYDTGKIDAICGDGPWVISTIKYLDYSNPYFYAGVYAYGRADETRFSKKEDLNRKDATFIGIDGDVSVDLVRGLFPSANIRTMQSITDSSQLLLNVATKKADLVLTDPLTAESYIKNNPGKIKRVVKETMAVYGGGFSVRKGEADLLNTLNEAVDAALNTGIAEKAFEKYDPDRTLFLPVAKPYEVTK